MKKKVIKYQTGVESVDDWSHVSKPGEYTSFNYDANVLKQPSFKDKAGEFMGNYGGAITKAAGTLAPLLMKKTDPNARPYKKGSKLIKYQEGTKDTEMLPEDLLSRKDRVISQFPKFLQKTFAKKAMGRIEDFENEMGEAKKSLNLEKGGDLSLIDENRITRKILSNRKSKEDLNNLRNDAESARNNYEARLAGEEARKTYETRLAGETARSAYEEKQRQDAIKSGIPSSLTGPSFSKESVQKYLEKQAGGPVSTEKNPILYKEPKTKMAGQVTFKNMTPAQQKQYRAGIASGKEFSVEGIGGKYGAASNAQMAQSSRMAGKGGSSKPLVKMKEAQGSPEDFWKKLYKDRQPTLGKNFDRGQGTTAKANNTGNVLVSKDKMGKSFDPYSGAFFTTPFNQPGAVDNTTLQKGFSSKDIMAKRKELTDLRDKIPGWGPFRSGKDSESLKKIDYLSSKLYTLSQKQDAYERMKKRGDAGKQAEIEAREREKELKRISGNLKF